MIAPAIVTGNTCVVLASEDRPLPAITLAEVLATSDLPGGVVNLLTGRVAETAPWLAGHMDVNAIDLTGVADGELATELEIAAAENLKRVLRPSVVADWAGRPRPRPHARLPGAEDGLAPEGDLSRPTVLRTPGRRRPPPSAKPRHARVCAEFRIRYALPMPNRGQADRGGSVDDWLLTAARTAARTEDEVAAAEPDEDAPSTRSTRTEKLWADVRIDPVEIALPGGVGYTLRAYRSSAEITRPEVTRADEDDLDDFDAASAAVARRRRDGTADDETDVEDLDEEVEAFDEDEDADLDEEDLDEDEDREDEDEDDEDEDDEDEEVVQDVPVFLGRDGRVYLFHSPDKLVEFVKSGAEHDLSQIDTWGTLVKRISSKDVVPLEEDTYELDLVVENLRGGPDVWDAPLILKAGRSRVT